MRRTLPAETLLPATLKRSAGTRKKPFLTRWTRISSSVPKKKLCPQWSLWAKTTVISYTPAPTFRTKRRKRALIPRKKEICLRLKINLRAIYGGLRRLTHTAIRERQIRLGGSSLRLSWLLTAFQRTEPARL